MNYIVTAFLIILLWLSYINQPKRTLIWVEDRGEYIYLRFRPVIDECRLPGAIMKQHNRTEPWVLLDRLNDLSGKQVEVDGYCGDYFNIRSINELSND